MTTRRYAPALFLLVPLLLAGCERAGPPDLLTVPASPPPPTSSVAAAEPVDATPPPKPVPTPSATALALGQKDAARPSVAKPPAATARDRAPVARASGSGPCAGLAGPALEECIDREARGVARVDEDAAAEFRAAQARRDQDLMDRDAEEAALATRDRDRDGDVDWRDRQLSRQLARDDRNRDGNVDWRDRRVEAGPPPVDEWRENDPRASGPYDGPPPEQEDVIYEEPLDEEPPPGDEVYYPPGR
jgi:hypothetical protein